VVKEYCNFGYRAKGDKSHRESPIHEITTRPFGVKSMVTLVVTRCGGLRLTLVRVGVISKKDLWFCVH
jgi:hypothetical protein